MCWSGWLCCHCKHLFNFCHWLPLLNYRFYFEIRLLIIKINIHRLCLHSCTPIPARRELFLSERGETSWIHLFEPFIFMLVAFLYTIINEWHNFGILLQFFIMLDSCKLKFHRFLMWTLSLLLRLNILRTTPFLQIWFSYL